MSGRFGFTIRLADDVVVEIQQADQRAVQEHGIEQARPCCPADHRAFAAGQTRGAQHGIGGGFAAPGKAAADGVEQQQFRALDRGRGDRTRSMDRLCEPFGRAFVCCVCCHCCPLPCEKR